MKRVKGVESVEVSLNRGEALLRLKPGNSVTVEQIRQIVLDNGFTPKGSDVEVAGKLVERNGNPALAVSGLDLVYRLVDHPEGKGKVRELSRRARNTEIVIKGHVPETTTKGRAEEARLLEVRDIAMIKERALPRP